jgi:hypothetical protein
VRIAQPYEAVAPAARPTNAPVVGSAPTMASRSVHGTGYNDGLEIKGNRGLRVKMQHPYAGQGLISPAFPYYQPSSVAEDAISVPILLTHNALSPVSHPQARYDFSLQVPARASKPSTKLPGINNASRRGGGAFHFPSPFVATEWPTSSQWLASQVRAGLTGGQ